jgi:hypothetical protein
MKAVYKNVEAQHLGGGVVVFKGAIEFDSEWVTDFAEAQISKERAEMYKPTNKQIGCQA